MHRVAEALRRELATLNLDFIKADVADLNRPHDLTPYMLLAEAAVKAWHENALRDRIRVFAQLTSSTG